MIWFRRSAPSTALRQTVLATVVVASMLGLMLALFRPPQNAKPRKTEWPTVARSNLVMRTGRWFSQRGTNLFTGWMADAYPEGSRLSRTAISNGLLNGLCESWFPNGQIQSRECFSNSVSNGPRRKWFENGQRQSEATIVNGVMEGTFRRWYDNGQLAEQIHMEHGQPNGQAVAYYPSGCLKAETLARAGQILQRQTWADGERRESSQAAAANGGTNGRGVQKPTQLQLDTPSRP